jgi:hypothetical protein
MDPQDMRSQASRRRELVLFLGLVEGKDGRGEVSNIHRTQKSFFFMGGDIEAAEHFFWTNVDFAVDLG